MHILITLTEGKHSSWTTLQWNVSKSKVACETFSFGGITECTCHVLVSPNVPVNKHTSLLTIRNRTAVRKEANESQQRVSDKELLQLLRCQVWILPEEASLFFFFLSYSKYSRQHTLTYSGTECDKMHKRGESLLYDEWRIKISIRHSKFPTAWAEIVENTN